MDGWKKNPSSCSIAAYQVLSYENANGIRVAAWKHPTRVDGEVFVEFRDGRIARFHKYINTAHLQQVMGYTG